MSVLQNFAQNVENRGRYGIGWAEIIAIILPIVIDCFQNPRQMREASKGPTVLQRAGLRLRVRRELQRGGKFRLFQLGPAVNDLTDALLAQAKEEAESELMQGDMFADALEEAQMLAGN